MSRKSRNRAEPQGEEVITTTPPESDPFLESKLAALAAPPEPEQPPMRVESHPLELAPINSKIVVTADGAFLGGPEPTVQLERKDIANRLPVGAKIVKILGLEGQVGYMSTQLSPALPSDPKFYESVAEAIQNFPADHHPRR